MGLKSNGLGLASIVVGLAGLFAFKLFPLLCIPLCVLGVVVAIMARKELTLVLPVIGGTLSLVGLGLMAILTVIAWLSIPYVNELQGLH